MFFRRCKMFRPTTVYFVNFVIVTICAVTNNDNSTLRDRIPVYLQEVCRGQGVCLNDDTNDVIDPADEKFSCCGACSCSQDCEVKGNCCFQNQTKSSTDLSAMSRHGHKECLSVSTKPRFESFVHQSYYMISSSPDDADFNVRTNTSVTCGDVNVAPWGSILPVYSKQTGKIYKNRVCAEAFNVTDDEEWSVHLFCESSSGLYDAASFVSGLQDGFLPDYCFVKFIFDGEITALRSHICHRAEDYPKSECLPGFRMPTFATAPREDIVAACKSGLVSPFMNGYINIFCYICKSNSLSGSQCSSEEVFETEQRPMLFVSVVDTSVFRKKSDADVIKPQNIDMACPVDSVVQTDSTCRAISCPSGQIFNQDNRCVYPSKKWNVHSIYIHIVLTAEKNINTKWISEPLKNLQSPWPKLWKIARIDSEANEAKSRARTFLVTQHLGNPDPVNPKKYIRGIEKYINSPWFLKSNSGMIRLSAKLSKYRSASAMAHSPIKFELLYIRSMFFNSGYNVPITKLYYCDHVALLPTEYSPIGNPPYPSILNKITNETLLDGEFTVVDKSFGATVEVCLKKSGFARVPPNDSPRTLPYYLLIHCIATVLIILF